MEAQDKQELKEVLNRLQSHFNDKLKTLVEAVNANESKTTEEWQNGYKAFREALEGSMKGHSDTLDNLRGQIENRLSELENAQPNRIAIDPQQMVIKMIESSGKESEITLNAQHSRFPDLVLDLKAGHNIYNYGPTGSGKTVAVYTAAEVLKLKVYRKVLNRETSPYIFSGYMKGQDYIEGMAFRPYTEGGILFADELDNGNANAGTTLKEYADADEVWFPHGLFKKHPDFRLVANANTIGNGANQSYVGRNQQDKALLNIFKFHHWDYDEAFETTICWSEYLKSGGAPESKLNFDNFLKSLRDFRRAIAELNILHILSPRNFKQASRDFALGRTSQHIIETIVLKGLDDGQTTKIIEKIKGYYPKKQRSNDLSNLYNVNSNA